MTSTIVVALGGNALQRQGEASSVAQQKVADQTVQQLIPLIKEGNRLAIVHGNGPQVGNIVLHEEAINTPDVPTLPLEDSGAMSQGLIGFWLQQALRDAFHLHQMNNQAVSVVTQTLVDLADPAFSNPSKPIGPFYNEDDAKKLAIDRGFTVKEDAGRGWRRVVPSPHPKEIIESEVISQLVNSGIVTVSTGGGGIPVVRDAKGLLSGVEAVIDKDFAAAALASQLGADTLLILTSVDSVKINYGQENEQSLGRVVVSDVRPHIESGQFAAGSMLPKVQAAIEFVNAGENRRAIITSLDAIDLALSEQSGTIIRR